MTAKDFNNCLTSLVLETVREGVHSGQTTIPQLVGVLRAHADELWKQHERLQRNTNGAQSVKRPPASPPAGEST